MSRSVIVSALVASLLTACGPSDEGASVPAPTVDAGAAKDSGTPVVDASMPATDAGSAREDSSAIAMDAGAPVRDDSGSSTDSGSVGADASVAPVDAGSTATDAASRDAGPACHALAFGRPEVPFIEVPASELGVLNGGAIVDGTYDLVAVETSTSLQNPYALRSTWRFAGNTLEQVEQLRSSSLAPVAVRSGSFSVSGNTFTRVYTCGSTDATPSRTQYDSRVVSGVQTIRLMSGASRLTYEKR
jgi:hypothetical protein